MRLKNSRTTSQYVWPSLPYAAWHETLDTLHLWMQIAGKVKLALCPFLNQWWETAFYLTPTGMTTGRIPYQNEAFSLDFHFTTHSLEFRTSTKKQASLPLEPCSVAAFYKTFMHTLEGLGIHVTMSVIPQEVADPIAFNKDTNHASYERDFVERWWQIQLQSAFIFDRFRSSFRGKSSPIHFYWGSFDLSGTRFSGNKATPPKVSGSMGKIMRYAENEENFAFGFWPGDTRFPYPAFYTYIYPAPKGYETIKTGPSISYYNKKLSECILPYDDICQTLHPEKNIFEFLETTYHESAKLAGWDITSLESTIPD